jgi:hypothetical protein
MLKNILCLLAAALTLGACSTRGPYELSLRLPKGRVLSYRTTLEQTVRQVLPGEMVTVRQSTTTAYRFTVRETASGGGALLEVLFEDLSLATRSPAGELQFDSKNPERSTPALRGLQSVVGQSLLIQVDRQGHIREVQGLEAVIEKARSSEAAGSSPAFAQALERFLSPEAIEANLAGFFEFYPARKVLPGDSWLTERTGTPGLALGRRDTWKLLEVRRGRAHLAISGIIGSAASPAGEGLSGTEEGSVEAELATGALISATTRQQLRGSIVLQGLQVPMEISGTATIRQTAQSAKQ